MAPTGQVVPRLVAVPKPVAEAVGPNLAVVVAVVVPRLVAEVVGPNLAVAVAVVAPNLLAAEVLLLPDYRSLGRTWRLFQVDFHSKRSRCSEARRILRKTAGHN